MSACSTAPRAGSTSPPTVPPLRTGAAPAGGPGRRRDQPVRRCGVAEGTPARRRAQPVGTHDPDTGVTGVSCPVPGHPTGHGRQRSAGGPDRGECGLRGARWRDHRPVTDRPPRRRPAPGRLRGPWLPRTRRRADTSERAENSHHRVVGFLWGRTGKPTPYVMQRQHERIRVHGRYVLAVDDGNACLAADWPGWACSGCRITW